MNSTINSNQKQIYDNYSKFQNFSDIINNKLGKSEDYFKNVCGKDDIFIKTYISNLGITDDVIISCALNASKKCTLKSTDSINSTELMQQISKFRDDFLIELYSPYYKILYDIKKGIQVIIDLYDNMQPTTLNKNSIYKNNEYYDRLGLNVSLFKSHIDPNIDLNNYFDLNNLSSYTIYDIACEAESVCKLSINSSDTTIVSNLNKKIIYLKSHILYTSTPEQNCIIIANDYSKKNSLGGSSNTMIFIIFFVICVFICCIISCMMYLQNRRNMGYETYNYTDTF
jgi:hypothetical protein